MSGTNAKLTPDEVREIRVSTLPGKVLALNYGVAQATIYKIKRRLTWKEIH